MEFRYDELGTKIWEYKATFDDGHVMLAQSRIKIQKALILTPAPECNGLYAVNLMADHAYLGQKGKITLTIDIAQSHCDITKPLIVAEGFDVGTLLNPENSNGMSNINNFEQSIQFSYSSDLSDLLLGSTQHYDIIYVDWENGVDYMQRNAYALEKAIEYVNDHKEGNAKNVVLGQSMGGVIARYALSDMENRGDDHDTRLFISDDAPQQGANVPLSFQYLYRHLTNQYIEASSTLFGGTILVPLLEDQFSASTYLSILDAPASRQLLKEWSGLNYNLDNSVHNDFYGEMRNLNSNNGYPQDPDLRMVAISNGSECGSEQTLAPDTDLLDFEYNHGLSFWGDLASLIYNPLGGAIGGLFLDDDFFEAGFLGLIPGHSSYEVRFESKSLSYGTDQIYEGLVRYHKKIAWVFNSQKTITHVEKTSQVQLIFLLTVMVAVTIL